MMESNMSLSAEAQSLQDCLLSDLKLPEPGKTPHYLYALVDMGRMSEDLYSETYRRLEPLEVFPLLSEPKYEALKDHGPMLVSCGQPNPDGDSKLLKTLLECNSDVMSAWMVGKLPPKRMAEHLGQGLHGTDKAGKRFLVRYYDPLSTPILYRLADAKWTHWLFGSLVSWWYPVVTKAGESWHRLQGDALALSEKAVPLVLTEELWEALESDPLPYRLLNFVEEIAPEVFADECYGVRLARIEGLLENARRQGLTEQNDLIAYVMACARHPERQDDSRWHTAVQNAAAGLRPLDASLG
jgi:hypothetical protein